MAQTQPPPLQQPMNDVGGRAARPWAIWFQGVANFVATVLNYQTVQFDGVAQPVEPALNFLDPFIVADNPANGSTDISLTVTPPPTPAPVNIMLTDQSSARTFGTIYQNPGTTAMYVSGFGHSISGSAIGNLMALVGPTSPPALPLWQMEFTATVATGPCGFVFLVPAGYYYEVLASGDVHYDGTAKWFEGVF